MNRVVLDSSAILARMLGEPGADVVGRVPPGAAVSTVNVSEVLLKLIDKGMSKEEAVSELAELNYRVHHFTEQDAAETAGLRKSTKHAGLSFGDRACLALAIREGAVALTGDRDWMKVDVGVQIELIR